MKKLLILSLLIVALTACGESELESAEETLFELREEKKQDANFRLLNSHIIGAKDDAPQGKQGDCSSNKSKEN